MLGKRATENMKEKKGLLQWFTAVKQHSTITGITADISREEGTIFLSLDTPSCAD